MSTYDKITTAEDGVKRRLKRVVKDNLPFIILFANIIGYAATKLFDTSIVNPFTPEYFAGLFTNMLSTALTYVCFLQYGERMGRLTIQGYDKAVSVWSEMSGRVRASLSEEFTEHCKRMIEQEREEKRIEIILNNTTMSADYYARNFRRMTPEKLAELRDNGTISKREYKAIKKANGTIRIKPINPLLILCGVRANHINDAGRDGLSYRTISMLSRPVVTLAMTACITMFRGAFIGVTDTAVICDIIYIALMIVIASYTGYSAGVTSARREFDKIKGRVFFLEDFLKNKA